MLGTRDSSAGVLWSRQNKTLKSSGTLKKTVEHFLEYMKMSLKVSN